MPLFLDRLKLAWVIYLEISRKFCFFPLLHNLQNNDTFLCKWTFFIFFSQAECSITGSSHFTTFDGRHFTFLGICQYILVKGTGKNKFTITLQKAPCGQVSHIFLKCWSKQVHPYFRQSSVSSTVNYLVMLNRKYKLKPSYSFFL